MSDETQESNATGADLLASLQAENAQLRMEMQAQLASQQETISALREENQLLLRRLYGNRSERGMTTETQLSFDDLVKAEKALQKQLDDARKLAAAFDRKPEEEASGDEPAKKRKPSGRRNLAQSSLPRIEVEIDDARFEGVYPPQWLRRELSALPQAFIIRGAGKEDGEVLGHKRAGSVRA